MLDTHLFQFCPKCKADLVRKILFDDGFPRLTCPECSWVQLAGNAVGVAVVAHRGDQIAVIQPPGEDGIGLPAGLVEYGESPEDAAVREVSEETGLEVRIIDELGWFFDDTQAWPGPNIKFMYEAEIVGGELRGSDEGPAILVNKSQIPPIASGREGSKRTLEAYLTKNNSRMHDVPK